MSIGRPCVFREMSLQVCSPFLMVLFVRAGGGVYVDEFLIYILILTSYWIDNLLITSPFHCYLFVLSMISFALHKLSFDVVPFGDFFFSCPCPRKHPNRCKPYVRELTACFLIISDLTFKSLNHLSLCFYLV